ncbi:MAG: hypothetical protein GW748_05125 [Alphaproteobacteria bacterium]|nr:hypothetical protein [Alphaproteobacteria bacterium]NCQ67108.1 hypothetical protein [Alphaproteobacteria bacterium]NCT07705.1 hypothetical protein [Alphaproteobacteria bacterium]
MTFGRDNAFNFNLIDPENPDADTAPQDFKKVGDDLIIFCGNHIFRSLTAETIDPENNAPDTRHSSALLYRVGTKNISVSRCFLQSEEMIKVSHQFFKNSFDLNDFILYLWQTSQILFECETFSSKLKTEFNEKIISNDRLINQNKINNVIPPLNLIQNLNNDVVAYLSNAKRFLIQSYRLLEFFYDAPHAGSNFKQALEWMAKKLGEDHNIVQYLQNEDIHNRKISNLRNSIEHPKEDYRVTVENFSIGPDNKFMAPSWEYNLTEKIDFKSEGPICLSSSLDTMTYNLAVFFEALFVACIDDKLQNSEYGVFRINNTQEDHSKKYKIDKKNDI